MQRTVRYPSFASSDLEVNPTIKVVIVYEDFEAGKHAKATYDFLVEHLGHECQFTNQMWKFDVLTIAKLREIAAKDAAFADIIIVACRGDELPSDVKGWFELWLAERSHPIALVGLFNEEAGPEISEAARSYLAEIAQRGRMEFFAKPTEWNNGRKPEAFLFARGLDSRKTLSTLAGVMERDLSFPRWGINE
jgi:hypothetical protein